MGPIGKVTLALLILLAISPFAVSVIKSNDKTIDTNSEAYKKYLAMNNPSVIAANKAKAKEEEDFQNIVAVLKTIKRSARNPKSVEWEDIAGTADGKTLCVQLTAQNGFGGMTREYVTYTNGTISNKSKNWDNNCAGRHFKDWMFARNAM